MRPTAELNRPQGPWLVGLSWKRAVQAALIAALIAGLVQPYVRNSYLDLLTSTLCLAFAILVCHAAASSLRLTGWRTWVAQALAVILGAHLGTLLTVLVKGKNVFEVLASPEKLAGAFITIGVGCGLGAAMLLTYRSRERRALEESERLRAQAARSELEKQVLAAQLKLMQAQVEPHFLFNTLAAVQHQVEVNPPAAGRLLSSLVRYLRAALPQMRSDLSTVGREFDLARAYLEIAAGRLCGRLAFEVNLPEELAGLAMPPMMLISLVENAITHGVEQCSEDCRVRVCARREQDRLLISVEDDGAGLGDPGAGCGIGLSNLRARLQVLYGDHAGLALHARTPRGVTARIDLPLPP